MISKMGRRLTQKLFPVSHTPTIELNSKLATKEMKFVTDKNATYKIHRKVTDAEMAINKVQRERDIQILKTQFTRQANTLDHSQVLGIDSESEEGEPFQATEAGRRQRMEHL